jgi:hypothetical protein
MANPSVAVSGKKRRLSTHVNGVCSVCDEPAAVSVETSSTPRRQAQPFCLLHYYTTGAVRKDHATILDQDVVDQQLQDGVQELFAETFLEIQLELAHESASAFQKSADPLAIVNELRGKPKSSRPRKKAPPARSIEQQGGFMRQVPLPERLLKTQQEQAWLQREQVARMTAAATTVNPYERRKPSRQSIWNLAMKEPTKEEAAQLAAHRYANEHVNSEVTCSCGSNNVSTSGNVTSRGGDMAKGETWGSKDRGDSLFTRYQCETCGRMWTEED